MTRQRHAHGFTNVDSQPEPRRWVRVLDKLAKEPFYRAYKARMAEMLSPRPNGLYLELGGGTGDDARRVAQAASCAVFALDASLTMLAEARKRGSDAVVVARAAELPFPDDTFDGCWADRLFQHLEGPEQALAEAIRVTKPDGRIVLADPDYSTQTMDFPDENLVEKVFRFRAEHSLRNGTLAHRMPAVFEAAGLISINSEIMDLVTSDPSAFDNIWGLRTWAGSARKVGLMTASEVRHWESLYDQTVAEGRFRYSVSFFLTVGTKQA